MNICIINNTYEPFNRGGADRIAKIINQGFVDAGHDTFVIAAKPYGEKVKPSANKTKIYFVNSFFYSLSKWPKILRLFWHGLDLFDIRVVFSVWRILKKERSELVITNNLKGLSYLLPWIIHLGGFKHIHILHDIQLLHPSGLMIYNQENKKSDIISKIYKFFCRWLFSKTNKVISPSAWLLKEHLNNNFFSKSETLVMPNPLAEKKFPIDLAASAGDNFAFIYIGEIEEHKGILLLIEAFKNLIISTVNRHIALTIVGTGSQDKKVRQLSENLPIKILGYIPNQEVAKILAQHNALVLPSLCYENSPTVIYEALTAGVPVIGSDLGGVGEIINNFSGLLFAPNNINDLTKKMRYLMDNYLELKNALLLAQKKLQFYTAIDYAKKLLA